MKKLIQFFSFIIIFMSFFSCANELNINEKASISFNFRAMDDVYAGSAIKVSVIENGIAIDNQIKTINLNKVENTPLAFTFNEVLVGSKVKVVAKITKVINEKTLVLYEGETEEKVITSGVNNMGTMTLVAKCPKIEVVPSLSTVIDKNLVIGGTYEVIINGITQKIVIEDVNTVLSIEFFSKINDRCSVKACIKDKSGTVIYDFEPVFDEVLDNKKIEVTLTPTRYMLWSESTDDTSSTTHITQYKIFNSDKVDPTWMIEAPGENVQSIIQDFFIDNNQVIWVLQMEEQRGPAFARYESDINSYHPIQSTLDLTQTRFNIPTAKVCAYFDKKDNSDVVFFVSSYSERAEASSKYIYYIPYVYVNNTSKCGTINIPCATETKVSAATTDGNNLYVAEVYTKLDEVSGSTTDFFRILNFGSVTSLIETKNCVPEVIYDGSKKTIKVNNLDLYLSDCVISDLKVIDNFLYALVYSKGYDSSKGGVLKINLTDNSITASNFYTSPRYPDQLYGGVEQEKVSEEMINTCLLSPRKFVALKPKKLVIADDGAYLAKDGNTLKGKNRVVTIDLVDNMKMTVEDLNTISFTGYIDGTPASGFTFQNGCQL